jgi:diacylglycerol kinase family enzyme
MTAISTDPVQRLKDRLASSDHTPSKRLLIIVNPYATTVSDRLKNLVVYALRGSYQVDAIDTERRDHATELCREAANEGYDVVVAFGGDGTVNEAAHGLAGSDTPLSCLPGGRANVVCRILGIPTDVVDATEHLLALADDWQPRRIDLGRINDRHFVFAAGIGLDARVVEVVDAHPRLKARLGEWYYTWVATNAFNRRYLFRTPSFEADLGGEPVRGLTAIIQNTTPYTYFGERPVDMGDDVALDSGDLAGVVLKRARPLDMPTIAWRALSKRFRVTDHRQIVSFSGLEELTIRSIGERPLPIQVDGDYIGETDEAHVSVVPGGLTVIA